jgi:hypothetical protein
MHQTVETEAHGEDSDKTASQVAENILGVKGGAQMSLKGEIAENRHHGKSGAIEGDLPRGDFRSGRLDQRRHANEDQHGQNLEGNALHRVGKFGIHAGRTHRTDGSEPKMGRERRAAGGRDRTIRRPGTLARDNLKGDQFS